MQKINISFFLNERPVNISVSPQETALRVIRDLIGLTGTKEGCSEGDCGACTIALGSLTGKKILYRAVTSCILPAAKLHKCHVITIEGLAQGEKLHPIQQAILQEHATQCGFCTPGVIMSLFCLFTQNPSPTSEDIDSALEGNLCRCTGYISINKAALKVSDDLKNRLCSLSQDILPGYVPQAMRYLLKIKPLPEFIKVEEKGKIEGYHIPQNLKQLWNITGRFKNCRQYRFVSGGTDVMVDMNIKGVYPPHLIDISQIQSLHGIKLVGGHLHLGSAVTLVQVAESPLVKRKLPVLTETVKQMASAQIRNIATLAGNLSNASPIADAGVLLLCLDAKIELASPQKSRLVAMDDFYRGYRQTCLGAGEIITGIQIPLDGFRASFLKSAKRRAVDIASVNSAVKAKIKAGEVVTMRIALGGVAPTPVLAKKAALFLKGKRLDDGTISQAAEIALSECSPISDVRGGAEYRRLLVKNHLIRHLSLLVEGEKK